MTALDLPIESASISSLHRKRHAKSHKTVQHGVLCHAKSSQPVKALRHRPQCKPTFEADRKFSCSLTVRVMTYESGKKSRSGVQ
jgi:hypothetical protein